MCGYEAAAEWGLQPMTHLAFWAGSAHGLLMPSRTPKSFLARPLSFCCWVIQPFPYPLLPVCQHCLSSLTFLFLVNISIEALLIILCIPCPVQFPLHPSLHNWALCLYPSQGACLCSHSLCICSIPFSLTSRSLLVHASLLPFLSHFLHLGIASTCTLLKISLICQLCSTCSFLRASPSDNLLEELEVFSPKAQRPNLAPSLTHIPQDSNVQL